MHKLYHNNHIKENMAKFSENLWDSAILAVKQQFEVEKLLPEQVQGIKVFFETLSHIFVNLPTGSGESLIYQGLPIVADILHERPRVLSTILVISPLQALMRDQVNNLQNLCLPAIAVVDEVSEDPEFIQQIMNGVYTHVYRSPECLLASKTFCERLIGVAIDKAHCIVQW
jgi:ATP-dependent DNA helicase RecQ